MKRWMQKVLAASLVVLATVMTTVVASAQAIDTNLTAMVTAFDSNLTEGTGAHTVYWVVGLGVGLTLLLIVLGFVKRGRRA